MLGFHQEHEGVCHSELSMHAIVARGSARCMDRIRMVLLMQMQIASKGVFAETATCSEDRTTEACAWYVQARNSFAFPMAVGQYSADMRTRGGPALNPSPGQPSKQLLQQQQQQQQQPQQRHSGTLQARPSSCHCLLVSGWISLPPDSDEILYRLHDVAVRTPACRVDEQGPSHICFIFWSGKDMGLCGPQIAFARAGATTALYCSIGPGPPKDEGSLSWCRLPCTSGAVDEWQYLPIGKWCSFHIIFLEQGQAWDCRVLHWQMMLLS